MERVDNIGFGNYIIYQDDSYFLYGTDAVLLSCFTSKYAKKGERSLDFGTNTGIVPTIILSKRREFNFTGIEVQKRAYELAIKSSLENNLNDKLSFLNLDILDLEKVLDKGTYDLVTINPPYMESGKALDSTSKEKLIARTETTANLEDFIRVASSMLKSKGELFMVNRPYRLVDIFTISRKYRLEPKRIQFISPRKGENPNLTLISFTKDGGKELTVLNEIAVRDGEGYSKEFINTYRDF